MRRAVRGGYPEALRRPPKRRSRWFESYLDTTLTRDLADLEALRRAEEMPRLLSLLATQAANIVNWTSLGGRLGLDRKTVHAYASLLETVYLVRTLPGWRPGLGNREVQAPKVYLGDSGLLAALLGADERRVASDGQISGKVYENFVAMEVVRHLPWAETAARPYHYRDSARRRGGEIDLLFEDRAGRLVAIEAKARASVEAAVGDAGQRPLAVASKPRRRLTYGLGRSAPCRAAMERAKSRPMASAASSGVARGSSARIAADAIITACWMTCQRSTEANCPPDSAWTSSNASRWARMSSFRRSLNSSPAPSPNAKGNGNSSLSLTV